MQRPDLSVGDGIYTSVDGGKTWEHLGLSGWAAGLREFWLILRMRTVCLRRCLGILMGRMRSAGFFFRRMAAKTWTKCLLYKDADTGAMDLAFDPTNSQTI